MLEIGDIPGGTLHGGTISHASVASNGAAATYGGAAVVGKFRAPQACRIMDVAWEPTGADQDATQSASYRRLTLVDGGADATGTTVLASLNLSASLASDAERSFSLVTTPTLDKGDVVYASQATVGGAHSNGTVLRAGVFHIRYKPI